MNDTVGADACRADSCRRFADYVREVAARAAPANRGSAWFVLTLARQCANVDLSSLRRPVRFWRSLREEPPVCFGPRGFRPALTDDHHPARHYCAFLAAGFFLPYPLAVGFGWLWEHAEGWFLGQFSPRDVALGRIAVQHARIVRREGPDALAALIQRDLCQD